MKNKVSVTILGMKDFYTSYMNREYSFMNKAFIALCFGQSLPGLPPLGHRELTAFYRGKSDMKQ